MNPSESKYDAVLAEAARIREAQAQQQRDTHKTKSRLALEWAKLCKDGDDRRLSRNRKESA
jgi:hypothetical protein